MIATDWGGGLLVATCYHAVLTPHSAFTDTIPLGKWEEESWGTSLQSSKGGIIGSPFHFCWPWWDRAPVFLWCLSKLFCLARLLSFLVLCLKRSCFSWISLCVCPLVFSVVSFFTIYDILGKNKTQGTHHCLVPWVWSSLASLPVSLHFLQTLYVCDIYFYIRPGFLVVLSRRNREKYVYYTKAEVSFFIGVIFIRIKLNAVWDPWPGTWHMVLAL